MLPALRPGPLQQHHFLAQLLAGDGGWSGAEQIRADETVAQGLRQIREDCAGADHHAQVEVRRHGAHPVSPHIDGESSVGGLYNAMCAASNAPLAARRGGTGAERRGLNTSAKRGESGKRDREERG